MEAKFFNVFLSTKKGRNRNLLIYNLIEKQIFK